MKKLLLFVPLCLCSLLMFNCAPDAVENETLENEGQNYGILKSNSTQNVDHRVNFTVSDRNLDNTSQAEDVFENDISGWDGGISRITGNRLYIDLQETAGSGNGMSARINCTDKSKYEMFFDVKFEDGFDFAKGGKLGFGFAVGDGVTGGRWEEAVNDNKGGSFRVMWRQDDGNSNPYLFPYTYFKNMDDYGMTNGDAFRAYRFPIVDNKTYRIKLTIKTNTSATANDGYAKMEVRPSGQSTYTTVWEKSDMHWTGASTVNARKIKTLYATTFRGGKAGDGWDGNSGNQWISFDNLSWYPIN